MAGYDRRLCLAILAMTFGWALDAGAQNSETVAPVVESTTAEEATTTSGNGPQDGDSLIGDSLILDPISVTATRNPIKAFEYPGMVSVVGREEIQLRQASTPDDVLQFVPNVEFVGGPRRTGEVPSIRGFDGPDVVILLDGARQNFGSGHDGRFFVDPSLLKRVEVLRGPASALYGSGGTGGVIEFRTIDARDFLQQGETFGATVSGGYQSANDERVGTLSAFATPLDGLDVVASVTKRDSGTIDLGDGNELSNTDDDIIAGLGKVSLTFAEHHRLEGSFLRFDNDAEEANNAQGLGGDDIVDKEISNNTARAAYSYQNPDDDLFDLDLVAYYTNFKADEQRLDDNSTAGPEGELLKRDVDTLGLRLDNRSRLQISQDIMMTFTYGGEFYRDEQQGEAGGDERAGVPDADADFFGIFGQVELTFSEPFGVIPGELLVIPGLRYDYYDADSAVDDAIEEDKLSPRIGISYLPVDWFLLFANYAQAFRAPTFDELYQTGVHFSFGPFNNFFIPNPDLKPQETETVEFGGGFDFDNVVQGGDRLRIKASHFRIWGEDFIDSDVILPEPATPANPDGCNPGIPGDCDGITTTFNVRDARLWGTEVEASYESDRALLTFGYSTIDGRNDDARTKLGSLAPDQFAINAAAKLPEADAILGWRTLVARDFTKTDSPQDERDGYVVNDVYFAWQPGEGVLRGLRLDLGIDNVFDETYARTFTDSKEAGRSFKAAVSYSLKW